MSEVVYRSETTIVREKGPLRTATVPGADEPVLFGVHGAIAEHYKVAPDAYAQRASTIDYIIAAAGG
ncbi:MAG: hypothetical protein KY457_07755 [Actinobacteria bacterium]|nr:hypothetical protein [Actinomycetota bacterium]